MLTNLEESGGIGDIIPHPSLSSNAYLVLVYRTLCLRLLHPLIPIHLNRIEKRKKKNSIATSITEKREIRNYREGIKTYGSTLGFRG